MILRRVVDMSLKEAEDFYRSYEEEFSGRRSRSVRLYMEHIKQHIEALKASETAPAPSAGEPADQHSAHGRRSSSGESQ